MRFVCVHGHFYQPPREDPWTGKVPREASAAPFHDWNERITAECYGPNADNYSRISFNFGPTLLSWMEANAPQAYGRVLAADVESRERFSGHGSALAQAYGHMILPLARPRDKRTQVYWGIRDFEHRFGRSPEGMWLPETAVDTETLEFLAELGIRFTILSPHQALEWRDLGQVGWQEAQGTLEPRRPYEIRLPSGARIAALLLRRRGVQRDRLRRPGGRAREPGAPAPLEFRKRRGGTRSSRSRPTERPTVTTSREATAFWPGRCRCSRGSGDVRLTNFAEYLAGHPPAHEARIREEHVVELHPRGRTLEGGVRLLDGRAFRLETVLAGAAPGGTRLASRKARCDLRGGRREALWRSVEGARGFDRPAPFRAASPGPFLRAPRGPASRQGGGGASPGPLRDAALRDEHVHQLRLVLRGPVGPRDAPGSPLRGAARSSSPRRSPAKASRRTSWRAWRRPPATIPPRETRAGSTRGDTRCEIRDPR